MALIYGSKRSLYDIKELRNPAFRHVMLPVTIIQASNAQSITLLPFVHQLEHYSNGLAWWL